MIARPTKLFFLLFINPTALGAPLYAATTPDFLAPRELH